MAQAREWLGVCASRRRCAALWSRHPAESAAGPQLTQITFLQEATYRGTKLSSGLPVGSGTRRFGRAVSCLLGRGRTVATDVGVLVDQDEIVQVQRIDEAGGVGCNQYLMQR